VAKKKSTTKKPKISERFSWGPGDVKIIKKKDKGKKGK
jgi:hypothetical protein